jgi:hypothetical protein
LESNHCQATIMCCAQQQQKYLLLSLAAAAFLSLGSTLGALFSLRALLVVLGGRLRCIEDLSIFQNKGRRPHFTTYSGKLSCISHLAPTERNQTNILIIITLLILRQQMQSAFIPLELNHINCKRRPHHVASPSTHENFFLSVFVLAHGPLSGARYPGRRALSESRSERQLEELSHFFAPSELAEASDSSTFVMRSGP